MTTINHADDWDQWRGSEQCQKTMKFASEANRCHNRVVDHLEYAINAARAAGEELIEAKRLVPHGLWGRWLREQFSGSHETANVYMRIAREWHRIYPRLRYKVIPGRPWRGSKLTLAAALRILREEPATARARPIREEQPADEEPEPEPGVAAQLEQAVDELTRSLRDALTKLDPDTVLFWSRFQHGAGIAEYVEATAAELHPVARVVMTAYRQWKELAEADPATPPSEWEDLFRRRIDRAFPNRVDLTPRQLEIIDSLVKATKEAALSR